MISKISPTNFTLKFAKRDSSPPLNAKDNAAHSPEQERRRHHLATLQTGCWAGCENFKARAEMKVCAKCKVVCIGTVFFRARVAVPTYNSR